MSLIEFASMCDDPAMTSSLAIIELRHAKKFGTAWQAKHRLQAVIAADRSAVPCGRWVLKVRSIFEIQFLIGLGESALKYTHLRPLLVRANKPRYRYEVRR